MPLVEPDYSKLHVIWVILTNASLILLVSKLNSSLSGWTLSMVKSVKSFGGQFDDANEKTAYVFSW